MPLGERARGQDRHVDAVLGGQCPGRLGDVARDPAAFDERDDLARDEHHVHARQR
jgi:hypothetical protein